MKPGDVVYNILQLIYMYICKDQCLSLCLHQPQPLVEMVVLWEACHFCGTLQNDVLPPPVVRYTYREGYCHKLHI